MLSRKTILIGTILMFLALVPFLGWPIYKKITFRPASAALVERTRQVVEKNPQLKADWDKAMQEDGVLSWPKANAILEKVGEKADPEE